MVHDQELDARLAQNVKQSRGIAVASQHDARVHHDVEHFQNPRSSRGYDSNQFRVVHEGEIHEGPQTRIELNLVVIRRAQNHLTRLQTGTKCGLLVVIGRAPPFLERLEIRDSTR